MRLSVPAYQQVYKGTELLWKSSHDDRKFTFIANANRIPLSDNSAERATPHNDIQPNSTG
ncbi:MAG: hypothetical protein ACR2N1_07295 [Rubripirellula sp.]